MAIDVFGLGNTLVDIQTFIDDKLLRKLKITKGIMTLIDEKQSREVLTAIADLKTKYVPGGSCGNSISMIAMMGGKAVYSGVVADDIYGRLYENKISERGVKSMLRFADTGLTGTSIVLTSPDAERTMLTHLGVCEEFTKSDLNIEALADSAIFHTTGYEFDTPLQKEALIEAMKMMKKNGKKVSFDIADPFCIERNRDELKAVINEYVDILFGNFEEMKILTGCSDPIEAGKQIRAESDVSICLVKVGGNGSYAFFDDTYVQIPVYPAEKVLDSTGCGDIYAGGFLYGYTSGYGIEKSAHIASYLASKIIAVAGVALEKFNMEEIKSFIAEKILK